MIRQAQLLAFAEDLVARLEHELLVRIQMRCTSTFEALGEAATIALIRRCIQRCVAEGFKDRAMITRAIDSLFSHSTRVLASTDTALAQVMLELEAEALRSLLETAGDVGTS